MDDEDETRSTWTCPGCFRVFRHCGAHAVHLMQNQKCMSATMDASRVPAVCSCNDAGVCSCGYRKQVAP